MDAQLALSLLVSLQLSSSQSSLSPPNPEVLPNDWPFNSILNQSEGALARHIFTVLQIFHSSVSVIFVVIVVKTGSHYVILVGLELIM